LSREGEVIKWAAEGKGATDVGRNGKTVLENREKFVLPILGGL